MISPRVWALVSRWERNEVTWLISITGTAAAVERSVGQKGLLDQVSSNVMETHQTSLSRTRGMCDDIASLTKTLLSTVSGLLVPMSRC
jgi:hypothetical protein